MIVGIDAAQDVVFQTVFRRAREGEDFESWSELRVSRRSHRKENATSKRASSRVIVVHAHHPTTRARQKHARDFPVEIALKRRDRERETKKRASGEDRGARERKHTTRAKHTHVDVNSSASLRTGRSNTLKSKFKDVIDDAGRVCFFLPFKRGDKNVTTFWTPSKRDKKGRRRLQRRLE